MLFAIWLDDPFRPTRDVDFLGFGDPAVDAVATTFREICRAEAADDGVAFDADGLRAEPIREDIAYGGVRILTQATIGVMRIPIRIDIGFGDAVTPGPLEVEYPVLLDAPAPKLRAYPWETVIAEKFEALVSLGLSNSRMKDFHDLWVLSERFEFERGALAAAVCATFERRATDLPIEVPPGLGDGFAGDPIKTTQWTAFLRRDRLADDGRALADVVVQIRDFLMPVAAAARDGAYGSVRWSPGGPWRDEQGKRV